MHTRSTGLFRPALLCFCAALLCAASARAAPGAVVVGSGDNQPVVTALQAQILATGLYPDGVATTTVANAYSLSQYRLVVVALGPQGTGNATQASNLGYYLSSYLRSPNTALLLFYPNAWKSGTPPPIALDLGEQLASQPSTDTNTPASLGATTTDPLLQDVPVFSCGADCQRLTGLTVRPGARVVASWDDGIPLAIRRDPNRIDLNMPAADESVLPGSFSPEGAQLIRNAVRLLSRPLTASITSFPTTAAGVPSTATLTLSNTGALPVTLGLDLTGPDKDAFSVPALPTSLRGGQSAAIPITFRAGRAGTHNATLTFSVDGFLPITVLLSGYGSGQLLFQGAPVDFGGLTQGAPAVTRVLQVTNIYGGKLTLDPPTLSGAGVAHYTFDPPAVKITDVPPGGTVSYTLKYSPAATGDHGAQLAIKYYIGGSTYGYSSDPVPIYGRHGAPALGPLPASPLRLVEVPVGKQGQAERLELRNTGHSELIVDLSSSGAEFRVSPAQLRIPGGGSGAAEITFAPTATGARGATLTLATNLDDGMGGTIRKTLQVAGQGYTPSWTLDPAMAVDFGAVDISPTPATRTLTVRNTSDGRLTLTEARILPGPNAAAFSVAALPQVIPAGGQISVAVRLLPRAVGALTATLRLLSAEGPSQDVRLSAQASGALARVTPGLLSFEPRKIFSTGKALVTVKNDGNRELLLRGARVEPAGKGFTPEVIGGRKVAAGASTQFAVSFTPEIGGALGALLIVDTDDPATAGGGRFNVTLRGIGVPVGLQVAPMALSFGRVLVGQRTAPQGVRVRNTGSTPIEKLQVEVRGTQAPDFQIQPGHAQRLDPGQETEVQIFFLPLVAQELHRASLTVVADTLAARAQVEVSGSSRSPLLSVHPGSLSFTALRVGQESEPQVVAISNEGAEPLTLQVGAPESNDFVVDVGEAQLTLQPGQAGRVNVRFRPQAAGSRSDSLILSLKDSPVPAQLVPLSGEAIANPEPPASGCSTAAGRSGGLPVAQALGLLALLGLLRWRRRTAALALAACTGIGGCGVGRTEPDPVEMTECLASVDTDGDGLKDDEECRLGTDPRRVDTDGDGLSDAQEARYGRICVSQQAHGQRRPPQPCQRDRECAAGERCRGLDPRQADTDGDGIGDRDEEREADGKIDVTWGETDPRLPDTDGDGVTDGQSHAICRAGGLANISQATPPMGEVQLGHDPRWGAAVVVSGTAGRGAVLVDDPALGVSGALFTLPAQGDVRAEAQQTERDIMTAVGAGITPVLVGRALKTHELNDAVVSTYLIQRNTSSVALRDALVKPLCGVPAPGGAPQAGDSQFLLEVATVLRKSGLAGARRDVLVAVAPRRAYDESAGATHIRVNDLVNTTGAAKAGAQTAAACQAFVADRQAVADFLWTVDISGSMSDDQERLGRTAFRFFERLGEGGIDFRVGVMEAGHERLSLSQPGFKFIRGTDPMGALRLCQEVTMDNCPIGGSERLAPYPFPGGQEEPVAAAVVAHNLFQEAAKRGEADPERRLRPEATAVAFMVTDEPGRENDSEANDYNNYFRSSSDPETGKSWGGSYGAGMLASIVDYFQRNGVLTFGMVPVHKRPCAPNPDARDLPRCVIEGNGGATVPIGTAADAEVAAAMDKIVDAVVGATSPVRLGRTPITSTLKVSVRGQEVPRSRRDGFDYDAASRTIIFYGTRYRPQVGEQVVVSYRVWSDSPG